MCLLFVLHYKNRIFAFHGTLLKKLSKPKTTKIFNSPPFIRFYDLIIKSARDLLGAVCYQ